jgi:hypothetical protein
MLGKYKAKGFVKLLSHHVVVARGECGKTFLEVERGVRHFLQRYAVSIAPKKARLFYK